VDQGYPQTTSTREGLLKGFGLVTGAGSGIGRAIVLELARRSVSCYLVGRSLLKLREVARLANQVGVESIPIALDLSDAGVGATLAEQVRSFGRPIELLVHSAAVMSLARVEDTTLEHFTKLLTVNLLAPFAITKHLLPEICAKRGAIVFVNSSVVHHPSAGTGEYAASKHALKGFADALRQEVNAHGVRVISVYPGRTATPLQSSLCEMEGRAYLPDKLLQPEDIAQVVVNTVALPHTAEVTEIMIRPAEKP
jgi:NADP-dependent 3-hydroxy acid dehydrogenase YdfG